MILPCLFLLSFNAFGADFDLNTAIQNTKTACSGIDDSMLNLKKMAGINTAVTAVGTVAGGVALGTGIAKKKTDAQIEQWQIILERIRENQKNNKIEYARIDENVLQSELAKYKNVSVSDVESKISEATKKSKTLGNVRTGTLAASTVTNIAGTAIAATNKVDESLEEKINKCIAATKELANAKLAAKVEKTATESELAIAEKIINACRDYEYINISAINNRATGAAVASGIGVGTGFVGTITSAVANTDKTRAGDAKKEKNLNTTANVMSGASTVASATATIFNATQISAIKKVALVAEVCEGALK